MIRAVIDARSGSWQPSGIMRRFFVLSIGVLVGCASGSPLPSKKTVEPRPVARVEQKHVPLASGQAHAKILETQRLAPKDRQPILLRWAADIDEPLLQSFALKQLAYANDASVVGFATRALESSYSQVRTVAARVLALSEPSNSVRSALVDALAAASGEERTAIVWALVALGEKTIGSVALDELRTAALLKVTRLDGGVAFDDETFANLFSPEELAALAKDKDAAVRRLVASHHARRSDAKSMDMLFDLLKDKDEQTAAFAAAGLARIADKRSLEALYGALRTEKRERRDAMVKAIGDVAGGPGLVHVLASVETKDSAAEVAWFQKKQVFDLLKSLADPRVADPLVEWASNSKHHVHWMGEAGVRLAEVGDARAASFLAKRLLVEPTKAYTPDHFWEADEGGHLSRTDVPRVVATRMLADLAMIHPDKRAEFLSVAERATMHWMASRQQPHANGLRFLAAAGSTKVISDMRKWAFPKDPLPKKGDMPPFPAAFETAQMGLRYIGLIKDEPSYPKLLEQLQRKKDKTLNITQEGLMDGGMAMMGMALRAIGYGASQGLAHFGDARAVGPLMAFIEDEMWHEEARVAACEALAWCADGKTMADLVRKAVSFSQSTDPAKMVIGRCYGQTLSLRPAAEIVPLLVDLIGPELDADLRMAFGVALGIRGFDAASEEKLFRRLEDPASRQAAALALVRGGSAMAAARTVATMAGFGPAVLGELKDHYYRAFGYWSDADFEQGNIYRWVANAEAMSRVEVAGVPQTWARTRLQAQFDNLRFDNGPHSETRVVLRNRLYREAKGSRGERKKGAIETLGFMKERGALLALRDEPGETGALADKVLREVVNPVPE